MPLILLVEDDLPSRTFMAEALVDEGYQVMTADDGVQALALLTIHQPALIITSIQLPYLDGLTFCRQVQQHARRTAPPIIICSASLEVPDPALTPYAAFLEKPFDLTTFLDLVATYAPPPTPASSAGLR